MKCATCGGALEPVTTDLPFKVTKSSIVVVKNVPVLQCKSCPEYLLEDAVYAQVEKLLDAADQAAELEVVRFAA